MNHKDPTRITYIFAVAVIVLGGAWATFFPTAPYTVMVGGIVSLSGAFWVKHSSDQKLGAKCQGDKNGSI